MVRNTFQYGKDDWQSVNAEKTCPICRKDHNCKLSTDGRMVWCGRESAGAIKQNKGGQWLHRIDNDQANLSRSRSGSNRNTLKQETTARPQRRQVKTSPKRELGTIDQYQALGAKDQHKEGRAFWGNKWDVRDEFIIAAGAIAYPDAIHVCEVDPNSTKRVITQATRTADGRLRWCGRKGRNRGAVISLPPNAEAVLVPEGGSCAIATMAAQLGVVSRSTRNADLTQLAPALQDTPATTPIILIVENDDPKEGSGESKESFRAMLRSDALQRAEPLANILKRPVLVASPPEEHNGRATKDVADQYRAITDGCGRTMTDKDLRKVGSYIVSSLLSNADVVPPSESVMVKYRKEQAEAKGDEITSHSAVLKSLAFQRGGDELDADYDTETSCSFHKSFTRPSAEEDHQEFYHGRLACKSWQCPACRERKLKPEWAMHIIEIMSHCDRIYRKEIWAPNRDQLKKKLEAYRRKIKRNDGRSLSIQFSDNDGVIFSDIAPSGPSHFFDCRNVGKDFDALLGFIVADVFAVELQSVFAKKAWRPINACRDWSRGEAPTEEDAIYRLERVAEIASDGGFQMFITELASNECEQVLVATLRRNEEVERNAEVDFIAIQPACNVSAVVISSLPINSASAGMIATEAHAEAYSAMRAAFDAAGDSWRATIKTSPRWAPRATKRWRPLDSDVTPQQALSIAKEIGGTAVELDNFEPTAAMLYAAYVRFPSNDERENEYRTRISRGNQHFCPLSSNTYSSLTEKNGQIHEKSRVFDTSSDSLTLPFEDLSTDQLQLSAEPYA